MNQAERIELAKQLRNKREGFGRNGKHFVCPQSAVATILKCGTSTIGHLEQGREVKNRKIVESARAFINGVYDEELRSMLKLPLVPELSAASDTPSELMEAETASVSRIETIVSEIARAVESIKGTIAELSDKLAALKAESKKTPTEKHPYGHSTDPRLEFVRRLTSLHKKEKPWMYCYESVLSKCRYLWHHVAIVRFRAYLPNGVTGDAEKLVTDFARDDKSYIRSCNSDSALIALSGVHAGTGRQHFFFFWLLNADEWNSGRIDRNTLRNSWKRTVLQVSNNDGGTLNIGGDEEDNYYSVHDFSSLGEYRGVIAHVDTVAEQYRNPEMFSNGQLVCIPPNDNGTIQMIPQTKNEKQLSLPLDK